jgi:hypothetical protein
MPIQIRNEYPMHNWNPKPHKTPILPYPTFMVRFIEFMYCHDKFHDQALTHKHTKLDSLINTIQNKGWQTNPLIIITTGVRGAIHEHSLNNLANLKIPKATIKTLIKNMH